MVIIEDDVRVVGTFHLGEVYNIMRWADSGKGDVKDGYAEECGVFPCQKQDEDDESKFLTRFLVIT